MQLDDVDRWSDAEQRIAQAGRENVQLNMWRPGVWTGNTDTATEGCSMLRIPIHWL